MACYGYPEGQEQPVPDDEILELFDEYVFEDEPCVCGKPATQDYEGHAWCGKYYCAHFLQSGMDYHDEVGNR